LRQVLFLGFMSKTSKSVLFGGTLVSIRVGREL
jgi:hypothetical protein